MLQDSLYNKSCWCCSIIFLSSWVSSPGSHCVWWFCVFVSGFLPIQVVQSPRFSPESPNADTYLMPRFPSHGDPGFHHKSGPEPAGDLAQVLWLFSKVEELMSELEPQAWNGWSASSGGQESQPPLWAWLLSLPLWGGGPSYIEDPFPGCCFWLLLNFKLLCGPQSY